MQEALHNPVNCWLLAGALIIAFEALTAPGLGLFLGGLGALSAALAIQAGLVDSDATAAQFAWCFGATAAWTVLLWKPLRRFRMQRHTGGGSKVKNNNLIGEIAVVAAGGLAPGGRGQVLWSGTVWSAELPNSFHTALAAGAQVRIRSVSGNMLTVTPKEENDA